MINIFYTFNRNNNDRNKSLYFYVNDNVKCNLGIQLFLIGSTLGKRGDSLINKLRLCLLCFYYKEVLKTRGSVKELLTTA